MAEEVQNTSQNSYLQSDSLSSELDENNFFSPQAKPENIFCSQNKESTDMQLSSKILNFPFTLKFFQLIHLKDEQDPELIDPLCDIIFGDAEKIRYSESVLKMVFYSKDRTTLLNLGDYLKEIKTLTKFPGIEFICICLNKMFIQCENENITKEMYSSLQKSYNLFDLLYDEDCSIASSENQNKGNNSLYNSEKKNEQEMEEFDYVFSSDLLDTTNELIKNNLSEGNKMKSLNDNLNDSELFKKEIWNIEKNSTKKEKFSSETNNKEDNKTSINLPVQSKNSDTKTHPQSLSSDILNKSKNSNINPQMNLSLLFDYYRMNPFLLQAALTMQNIIKMQQINSKSQDSFNKFNFNENSNNINIDTVNNSELSNNNKELSNNSNTSSTKSSKESSPNINYYEKSIFKNNESFSDINPGTFNKFHNLNNNNNILKNNKEFVNDLLDIATPDNSNNKSDIFKNQEDAKQNNNNSNANTNKSTNFNSNLKQIVINNKYKEYIPKNNYNKAFNVSNSSNLNSNSNSPLSTLNSLSEKLQQNLKFNEKNIEFHTNSTRDYQYKYVSRYIVQIENEKNFPVTRMIIGNSGKLLRNILVKNCINFGDRTTKIRLRGKGSGYKEGPNNEESKDPMELCISSLNLLSYIKCSNEIESLLRNVYYQYYLYQCKNSSKEKNKEGNECPILMKKILKYQYVVNRYNTIVKEEKRKKKEEEMKQVNQVNKNNNTFNNSNNNNFINHE